MYSESVCIEFNSSKQSTTKEINSKCTSIQKYKYVYTRRSHRYGPQIHVLYGNKSYVCFPLNYFSNYVVYAVSVV